MIASKERMGRELSRDEEVDTECQDDNLVGFTCRKGPTKPLSQSKEEESKVDDQDDDME